PKATQMIVVEPDGRAEIQSGELFRPNGCAISADGRTFVVAETRLHRLMAFNRASDGRLVEPRVLGALPSGSWADGICLDAAGRAWVADPKAKQCVHLDADGTITDVIPTAPLSSIACVLGGPDRRTLFITLATIRPFPEMAADPTAEIVAVDVDVPGAG